MQAFLGEDEVEDLLGDEHDFQGLDFQIINEELGEGFFQLFFCCFEKKKLRRENRTKERNPKIPEI